MNKRLAAEFFGTFWLVRGGCGSAVISAAYPQLGIGFVGVALAFGLTVLTMVYAVGWISGGHFNPAVTVGLFAGGRFAAKDVVPYVIVQVLGYSAPRAMARPWGLPRRSNPCEVLSARPPRSVAAAPPRRSSRARWGGDGIMGAPAPVVPSARSGGGGRGSPKKIVQAF